MAESSRFWNTNNVGDGPTAGYDRTAIAGWMRKVFGGGILARVHYELLVSGSISPLTVSAGAAIVDGMLYVNTSGLNLGVTAPTGGTTGGRVVLRADWSAQTVRPVVKLNTDGNAAPPGLTQTSGTTYEISLCTFTITTAGAIGNLTLETARAAMSNYVRPEHIIALTALSLIGRTGASGGAGQVISAAQAGQVLVRAASALGFGQAVAAGIADNAIGNAKLRAAAALSILGRALGTSGDPGDIVAGVDGQALVRSGGGLLFAQLVAAMIANGAVTQAKFSGDSVDDAKVGNRVIQLRRHQGWSENSWGTPGPDNFDSGMVAQVVGCASVTIRENSTFQDLYFSLPSGIFRYGSGSNVIATIQSNTNEFVTCKITSVQTSMHIHVRRQTALATPLTVNVFYKIIGPAA